MRHRIRLVAQIHDRVRDAAGDVNERQVAEFAIGAIKTRGKLGRKFKDEARAFGGDLPEARIGHLRKLALVSGADPGGSGGLFVEQPHFAEELPAIEVGKHHFVAFLILDHDFYRATDDVIQNVGFIPGVDYDRLRRHRANTAVAQKPVDRRNIAQRLYVLIHTDSPSTSRVARRSVFYT